MKTATTAKPLSGESVVRLYVRKCAPDSKSLNLFAGVRGRVRSALAGQPSSITFSDAMSQVEKFRVARQTKS